MGKVDELRALREARYEAAAKAKSAKDPKEAKRAAALAALTRATATAVEVTTVCGHRSVGGKTCIREEGHVATGTKSHRYAKG